MKQLRFNVFAGNMYCGNLWINPIGTHVFITRNGVVKHGSKINQYKQLNLKRI